MSRFSMRASKAKCDDDSDERSLKLDAKMEKNFKVFDENGEGEFSKAKLKEILLRGESAFSEADANEFCDDVFKVRRSNPISPVLVHLDCLLLTVVFRRRVAPLQEYDANDDGKIQLTEFKKAWTKYFSDLMGNMKAE